MDAICTCDIRSLSAFVAVLIIIMIDALYQRVILFRIHQMHEACFAVTAELGKVPVRMIEMIEELRSHNIGCRRQCPAVDRHIL